MSCNELHQKLLDYLDGTIEPPEHERLAAHLGACPSCRRLVDEHEATWRALDLIGDVEVSADLHERLVRIPRSQPRVRLLPGRSLMGWLAVAAAVILAAVLAWQGGLFQGGTAGPSVTAVPDDAIIAQLDLIENLDFLQQHAAELDAHRELALLELLDPYRDADDKALGEGGDER